MTNDRIFTMKFSKVHPLYVQKAERKGRTREEVDQIICWVTGYDAAGLSEQIEGEHHFRTFFAQSPRIHPNAAQNRGVVCGVRVEEIEDPLTREDSLFGQADRRAGKGEGDGEDSAVSAGFIEFRAAT